jgi:hypothetical protein
MDSIANLAFKTSCGMTFLPLRQLVFLQPHKMISSKNRAFSRYGIAPASILSVARLMKRIEGVVKMKMQKIFRMQAVVIGCVAALFLASSAPAQEIENTRWNEGPNVAAFEQPAPAANGLKASAVNSSSSTAVAVANPVAAQESVVSRPSPVEGWVMVFSLIFMALLAQYKLAQTRRANRNSAAGADQANRTAILS